MSLSRTTVITVAYNSRAVLGEMLASAVGEARLIVVDNASTDDSAAVAAKAGAEIIRAARNEGFGRGCNLGAAAADTEFLFFVNPDARLAPGCIAALEAAADDIPGLVAANPLILRGNGRPEFRTSSILVSGSRTPRRPPPSQRTRMPVLTGSAFFCRRAAFEAVGGFDPAIFLYHEDHDLAVRLAATGGTLWHVPDAVVTHHAGTGSARDGGTAWLKGYHMARSRYYALAKHGSATPFLRTIGPSLLGIVLPHNLFSARRLRKYRGQISGALSALKDGGAYKG